MWCLYRKPTQVGEEKILRRLRELWLRNSANCHRNFGRRWASKGEGKKAKKEKKEEQQKPELQKSKKRKREDTDSSKKKKTKPE